MAKNEHSTIEKTAPVATSNGAALWRIVVAEYERAKIAQDRTGEAHNAAEEAASADVPPCRDFAAECGIRRALNTREEVLEALRYYPAFLAAKAAGESKPLSDAEADAAYADIPRIADEYMANLQANKEADEKHRCKELQEAFDAACSAIWDARDKLLATPAPDAEALLFKLDLLVTDMDEGDEQDAPAVRAIRDDARRILGRA